MLLQIEPLSVTPVSHMTTCKWGVPATYLWLLNFQIMYLLMLVSRKAAENGPNSWMCANLIGDPDEDS